MTRKEFAYNYLKTNTVVILRGIPGSGKTTLADDIATKFCILHCSADTYRLVDGQYIYRPEDNSKAHALCMRAYIEGVQSYKDRDAVIVVDNTNINLIEMTPYLAVANVYGWDVVIVTLMTPPSIAEPRNLHNVPPRKVQSMYDRLLETNNHIPRKLNHIILED